MGTFESWRRAYGALKDSTTVGLAKVGSDFKDLDIAIVKATNHDECPPKDLHVRSIMVATSSAAPRADVGYCIHTLSRRLMKTKNWIVAVKTLMVLHRILREGDPSFREELLIYSRRRSIFQIQDFKDDSSQLAWDCSSWIRTYATFLEERLECYRAVGFDIETERLATAPGIGKAYSRTRLMNVDELLEQLPAMQQLLYRLIACQPEEAAYNNLLIQHALSLVLKESLKIYCVINDGIIRLVESFFDMAKDEAMTALNIYKRSGKQTDQLAEFHHLGKQMRIAMNIQFPTLNQPPDSFLDTMEEYVEGVSSNGTSNSNKDVTEDPGESMEPKAQEIEEVENTKVLQHQEPEIKHVQKAEEELLPLIVIDDVDPDPKVVETKDNNASLGWELALVPSSPSVPSNNTSPISQGGGFDKLLLYSLYEDDMAKKQMQYGIQNESFHHHHYPPPQQDQWTASSGGPVQQMQQQQCTMNQLSYQQQYKNQYHQQCYNQQRQHNVFVPYNHQQPSNQFAQQSMSNPQPNPFGDGTLI